MPRTLLFHSSKELAEANICQRMPLLAISGVLKLVSHYLNAKLPVSTSSDKQGFSGKHTFQKLKSTNPRLTRNSSVRVNAPKLQR